MKTELQVAKWHIIKFVVIIVLIISSWKYGIEIFRGQSRRLTEWDNCNVVPDIESVSYELAHLNSAVS